MAPCGEYQRDGRRCARVPARRELHARPCRCAICLASARRAQRFPSRICEEAIGHLPDRVHAAFFAEDCRRSRQGGRGFWTPRSVAGRSTATHRLADDRANYPYSPCATRTSVFPSPLCRVHHGTQASTVFPPGRVYEMRRIAPRTVSSCWRTLPFIGAALSAGPSPTRDRSASRWSRSPSRPLRLGARVPTSVPNSRGGRIGHLLRRVRERLARTSSSRRHRARGEIGRGTPRRDRMALVALAIRRGGGTVCGVMLSAFGARPREPGNVFLPRLPPLRAFGMCAGRRVAGGPIGDNLTMVISCSLAGVSGLSSDLFSVLFGGAVRLPSSLARSIPLGRMASCAARRSSRGAVVMSGSRDRPATRRETFCSALRPSASAGRLRALTKLRLSLAVS